MAMPLILALVFGATLGVTLGGWAFVNRRRLAAAEALRERLDPLAPANVQVQILRDNRTSRLDFLDRLLSGRNLSRRISTELERAGSGQTVGAFVLSTMLGTVVGAMIGTRWGALAILPAAVVGACVPWFNMRRRQAARRKKLDEQLPEALDMLVNAMKAGYSLQAAMKFIGDEMSDPIGTEFTRFYDEQRLGMDVRSALLAMQDRIDTVDIRMFVTALLIQRESGGNLAEIMGNLATLMRERAAIRGQIDTLTAEPKASAYVLTAIPIVMFFLLSWISPDFVTPLIQTATGRMLMVCASILMVLGYLIMRKIADIDI